MHVFSFSSQQKSQLDAEDADEGSWFRRKGATLEPAEASTEAVAPGTSSFNSGYSRFSSSQIMSAKRGHPISMRKREKGVGVGACARRCAGSFFFL